MLHSVTTATPQRVSFMGGGSDIPSSYRISAGAVVSMAIRQYVYVTVKRHSPLFGEHYRVSYSTTESVNSVQEIQNDIVRACIQFSGIDEPLHVITSSDLPSQSGLGSSSSFCVGLLKALHEVRGDWISPGQLAEEACHIEMDILGKPIGKQDQYAAAFGGLNYMEFRSDDSVSLESLSLRGATPSVIDALFLVWTGVARSADLVLADQEAQPDKNGTHIKSMATSAQLMRNNFRDGSETPASLGAALSRGWEIKKMLGSLIQTPEIENLISDLRSLGSQGEKIAGAGGGGFVLGVAGPKEFETIKAKFGAEKVLRPGYCPSGSWTLGKVD